jgi:hypothetical protein
MSARRILYRLRYQKLRGIPSNPGMPRSKGRSVEANCEEEQNHDQDQGKETRLGRSNKIRSKLRSGRSARRIRLQR